jgi:hypothetical protein
MNKPLIALTVFLLLASAAWYRAHDALSESRAALVTSTLAPVAALLKEDQSLLTELQTETYTEKDAGILASYLIKIRRDGVAKHADMKQRLDELAKNNEAIVALTTGYLPNAKTDSFKTQANQFRDYAVAWRDRWNSVMELFMAGGSFAASGAPFPKDFPAVLDKEIAAAR